MARYGPLWGRPELPRNLPSTLLSPYPSEYREAGSRVWCMYISVLKKERYKYMYCRTPLLELKMLGSSAKSSQKHIVILYSTCS